MPGSDARIRASVPGSERHELRVVLENLEMMCRILAGESGIRIAGMSNVVSGSGNVIGRVAPEVQVQMRVEPSLDVFGPFSMVFDGNDLR